VIQLVCSIRKSAADIFDAGEAHGALSLEEANINGDEVHSVLETGSKITYDRMIDLSDGYAFPCCKMAKTIY
jgi:hypothetical protein